ncbi:putative mit domain-containing protein [Neofusicoccum parvum UCRNP2]|uniref:Putative mit domain-containing protein n=1 Tax=Botryosphaeria parva (strain UCR-NP2) TaxID=1287680 RepID=R1EME6_BOTPV|nr:putative mit domain-containing protein [Neofusicoccum parvum UCRNP2]
MHLFEADIHSPYSPGSPNPLAINAPIPLEPCPESYLLRPFWLMRCFYQTLAHPRGGYLSTKLFIPRDIWNVKGVKIKSVEEKISNCDLLTAALLKLGKVDTLDADAILEEMQALELVLDQVQSNLIKKLGSDVGTGGVSSMFKDAQTVGVTSPDGNQVARQVEDPGLKHSSPTHVGLELSTRHAAEFFGFYICRFVLSDIATMLDKFIKRGSEWVLI